jgi:hypothetical protein
MIDRGPEGSFGEGGMDLTEGEQYSTIRSRWSIFKPLFWTHQILLGLPSMGLGIELVSQGKVGGLLNVIALFLAWIGGTLAWGLAAIMHQSLTSDLPPVFTAISEKLARLEAQQVHDRAVQAVSGLAEYQ